MRTYTMAENAKFVRVWREHQTFEEYIETDIGELSVDNIDWLQERYDLFEINGRTIKNYPYDVEGKKKTRYGISRKFLKDLYEAKKKVALQSNYRPIMEKVVNAMRSGQYLVNDNRLTFEDVRQWVNTHMVETNKGTECKVCKSFIK